MLFRRDRAKPIPYHHWLLLGLHAAVHNRPQPHEQKTAQKEVTTLVTDTGYRLLLGCLEQLLDHPHYWCQTSDIQNSLLDIYQWKPACQKMLPEEPEAPTWLCGHCAFSNLQGSPCQFPTLVSSLEEQGQKFSWSCNRPKPKKKAQIKMYKVTIKKWAQTQMYICSKNWLLPYLGHELTKSRTRDGHPCLHFVSFFGTHFVLCSKLFSLQSPWNPGRTRLTTSLQGGMEKTVPQEGNSRAPSRQQWLIYPEQIALTGCTG